VGFFDLREQEERSFLSVVRHTVLEGPLTLVRFSDSALGHDGALGAYWMYGSEVLEAVAAHQGDRLIRELRRRWAISSDWGDLQLAWALHLPDGSTMNAYWGFAKFQPKVSVSGQKKTGRATTRSYEGGSIQLVLKLNEQDRKRIAGPFRTLSLAAADLRP
jgi:hypothetical protein